MEVPIDQIQFGTRHRKDLGDVDSLAESIERVGLLMPVAITTDKTLVAGRRRIAAFQKLGRDRITAHVVRTIGDAVKAVEAERDENTCRIPLAPLEAAELKKTLTRLLEPEAKARQQEGRKKGGKKAGRGRPSSRSVGSSDKAKSSTTNPRTDRTEDIAAKATGYSAKTLRQVDEVVKKADENPEVYGDLKDKLGKHDAKVGGVYKELQKRKAKEELDDAVRRVVSERSSDSRPDVRHCSMQDLLAELSDVDAIITDPPYPKEFLPLYGELAEGAAKALTPNGMLAVMCGQSYLPEIMALMTPHLTYRWTMAYLTPGGQAVQLWDRKVNTFWKPILIFGKSEERWLGDVVRSDVNDNDKRFHGWGQSESGMARLVESLTTPGQLVCDPFIGAGTTGVVCARLARKFVGCDISEEHVTNSVNRIILATEGGGESQAA